jgi:hypothetical protein
LRNAEALRGVIAVITRGGCRFAKAAHQPSTCAVVLVPPTLFDLGPAATLQFLLQGSESGGGWCCGRHLCQQRRGAVHSGAGPCRLFIACSRGAAVITVTDSAGL